MREDKIVVKFKGYNLLMKRVKTEPKIDGEVIFRDDCDRNLLLYLDRDESELVLLNRGKRYELLGIKGNFALNIKGKRDLSSLEGEELFGGKARVSSAFGFDIPCLEGGVEVLIFIALLLLFLIFLYPIYRFIAKPFGDWVIGDVFGGEILSYGYSDWIYVKVDTMDPSYDSKLKSFLDRLKTSLWAINSFPCIITRVYAKEEFDFNRELNNRVSTGRYLVYSSIMVVLALIFYLAIFWILSLYIPVFTIVIGLLVSSSVLLFMSELALIFLIAGFWSLSKANASLRKRAQNVSA